MQWGFRSWRKNCLPLKEMSWANIIIIILLPKQGIEETWVQTLPSAAAIQPGPPLFGSVWGCPSWSIPWCYPASILLVYPFVCLLPMFLGGRFWAVSCVASHVRTMTVFISWQEPEEVLEGLPCSYLVLYGVVRLTLSLVISNEYQRAHRGNYSGSGSKPDPLLDRHDVSLVDSDYYQKSSRWGSFRTWLESLDGKGPSSLDPDNKEYR